MRTKGSGAHCARKVSVHALMVTVAASSLMMGATQVAAQDAVAAEEDVEVVVVRGVRASAAKAVDVKRRSTQIVDSVIAEDIGKLPDNNVVEALQRLPGIQVTGRLGGETSGITIRGLPDIATTWNGRIKFTTTGRQQQLQDIPANLINRIDVYKTRTAEQLEHGLAGQIDVQTHRPFNFRGFQATAAVRGTWNEQADSYNPNLSALVSNRWSTSVGEVGALINISYNRNKFRNQNTMAGAMVPFMTENPPAGFVPLERFWPDNPRAPWQPGMEHGLPYAEGSTILVDGTTQYPYYLARDAMAATDVHGDRKRAAVNTAFQWRPNENAEYTLEYVYEGYRNDDNNRMHFSFADWWGSLGPNPQFTLFPGTNIIKTRTVNSVFGFQSADFRQRSTDTHILALNGKWRVRDNITIIGDIAYQKSDYENAFIAVQTERAGQNITVDFNAKDDLPSWQIVDPNVPNVLTDASQWTSGPFFDNADRHKGDALTVSLDGDWDANEGILKKVSFGVRYDDRGATQYHREQDIIGSLGRLLSSFPDEAILTNTGFFDGRSDVPTSWVQFNSKWLFDNADTVRTAYQAIKPSLVTEENFPYNRDFDVQEVTTSAYFQADIEPQVFSRPLLINFGLRYVKVETDMTFVDRLSKQVSTGSANTREVMPSLTLRYDLTDTVRLRYNYGETLRRPDFVDLNPNLALRGIITNTGLGTGDQGNPNLKAAHSKNTDIGVEWYFARDSVVSLTAFKREIEGLVVPGVSIRTILNSGQNTDKFIISQPLNASDGELKGIELGLTYFPDYLPGLLDGLGVQASATWLDSTQNIPIYNFTTGQLIGQDNSSFFGVSDFSYNITAAYERGPIGARLSYVWREDFLARNEARNFANPLGIWVSPEASLDFQLNYDVNDKVSLSLDAVNVLDEMSHQYYKFAESGGPKTHNHLGFIVGRHVSLGLRWRLN
ncbi:TonB-dependent receptor [Asticcacaulis tiandongensis]|uniref:TonB-dependent receptor n=1 Tax=Asticcacaulis tiandongensis TaxID=2565365 RepID=UPI00112897DA|nr:TonB-dependent receptor [Asticcacaulis tiandongensis]